MEVEEEEKEVIEQEKVEEEEVKVEEEEIVKVAESGTDGVGDGSKSGRG